ncbi:unnamed protein product [Strongylus vulgaris]|uniref:Reverse transcriptase domain-containing protein n=1 Tax=Strongylus vulgaris TaxID=40348 RepID=A0A3P7L947_STRVU|nr:unnamed protein product [Strongylus vulgaris]
MKPNLWNKLDFARDSVAWTHPDTFEDYRAFDSVETNAILSALSNLRFADDIFLFSRNITGAETMLKELNEVGKRIGLRINREKTQFMKNAFCEDHEMELEGSPLAERKQRAAWAAFGLLKVATDQLMDQELRAHLFGSNVLPALY